MDRSIRLERVSLGVCYYPEHWPESLWKDDFRRMKELNFSYVRMAEFSWALLEPEEGVFRIDWFDKALDLAHKYGLRVIMGTPSAGPPAWLTERYPEVLNATVEGVPYRHGMRRHYNYNSPVYREFCARITRKMAEHYGKHPAVVGWQIDNELNCEVDVFYSEADHAAFREWLKAKYGSLERLNEAWGTVFWSQKYTDWEQVHLTRPTPSWSPNPHQALDEKRFISDSAISFAKWQADILREVVPHHWITTNGMFGHLDNHALTERVLDFFSYDSYPQFATLSPADHKERDPLKDRGWSVALAQVRSISPNFCVMEQQTGPGGWVNRMEMPAPRPGQMRLWTYQSVMHGADLVLFFRWRTATFGTEIYWHGINDHHNRPNRRVREAAQIGKEIAAIGGMLAGTRYRAEVAIVRDYDNIWDGEFDRWHGPLGARSVHAWSKCLQYSHIPTDFVYLREQTKLEELLAYKALIYPHPAILKEETAHLLAQYVRSGGKLVFGARTGYKDERGHCRMQPLPGPVAQLCGITVEDYTLTNEAVQPATLQWQDESEPVISTELFNEILSVEDASVEVVARYASEYYAGKPALTRRRLEGGEVWYYGAAFGEPVVKRLIALLGLTSPVESWLSLPKQVELGIRASEEADYVFLLNYGPDEAQIELREETHELLSGRRISGKTAIEPYGVMILQRPRR